MLAAPMNRSWLDHWRDQRDRLLADAGFQQWAARFPLTRMIARRRARALFDLCGGFVYSQVLLACVRLHVFERLRTGPLTVSALAPHLGLGEDAALRLLEAAVSLRLLSRRRHGHYALGALGAALAGNPMVAQMIEHHALLYADLQDPVALLRGQAGDTRLARYWAYAGAPHPGELGADAVASYTALMSATQALIAGEVLDAVSLRGYRCLLDVGGGDGTFLTAAAGAAPSLRLMLFDLPPVAARARAKLAAAGLLQRSMIVSGDFLADPLPDGADLISLVRVVHDHDDASALKLLRAARRALQHDGTLLLAEPMASTRGAEPMGAAYFGFYLLAMGSGRSRTPQELKALLAAAGFSDIRLLPTHMPLQTQVLLAQPDPKDVNIS